MNASEEASARSAAAPLSPTRERPMQSLTDRWLALRNRLLMNGRFHRWAARFPLTRPITRRRTRELFDIAAGFVYSQVLHACVSLELLDFLAESPRGFAELHNHTGLDQDALQRLLLAATSLKLIQPCGDERYTLGAHGAAMLGNPGISAMVRHHSMLYADLADPVALLKDRSDSQLSRYWAYATAPDPGQLEAPAVRDYSDLMAQSQAFVASDILDAFPMRRHQRLLDLAGGEGVFVGQAARRWPHLEVSLFDLPAVAGIARDRIERLGLGDRIRVIGGDLFGDDVPGGFDLASLVRVVHDHDDAAALAILEAAHRALSPGGRLLIAEPMAGTPGAEPMGDAYFGLYLWSMGSGRARRVAELRDMLARAGFSGVREVRTARPLLVRLLVADA
jgi:demethylspheroidene O-methyltransferase